MRFKPVRTQSPLSPHLTLAQARPFFLLLPALPLRRFTSCIPSIARRLLLRSYSCILFGLQACCYLSFLSGGPCRLGCRAFLGSTPLRLSGRLVRKRLLARNARCFALGSPRLPRLDNLSTLRLTRLSLGIVRSGGCTEFLEQRRLGLCRCGLPLAEVGIVAHFVLLHR